MKKNSHNEKPPKASFVLEVIHSDIIGPLNKFLYLKDIYLNFYR